MIYDPFWIGFHREWDRVPYSGIWQRWAEQEKERVSAAYRVSIPLAVETFPRGVPRGETSHPYLEPGD